MTDRQCDNTREHLRAQRLGRLDQANEALARQHLASCSECRAYASDMAALVDLAHKRHVEPDALVKERIWQRARQRESRRAAFPLRWVAIGAAAAITLAVFLVVMRSKEEPPGHYSPSKAPLLAKTKPRKFDVFGQSGEREHELNRVGQSLDLASIQSKGGALYVRSAHEVIAFAPGSQAKIVGQTLHLFHGRVDIVTLKPSARELEVVTASGVRVRPVGTAYSVREQKREPTEVSVFSGKVDVKRGASYSQVAAGARLVGAMLKDIDASELKRQSARLAGLAALARGDIRGKVEVVAPAGSVVRVGDVVFDFPRVVLQVPHGAHRVSLGDGTLAREAIISGQAQRVVLSRAQPPRRAIVDAGPPPKRASTKPPSTKPRAKKAPATQTLEQQILAAEALLARGKPKLARATAIDLLSVVRRTKHVLLLKTLVAETYLKQNRHADAEKAYLALWRRHRKTVPGSNALYMAASLQRAKLGRKRDAVKNLKTYLKLYRKGGQREGAYYLLCRTLHQLGDRGQARTIGQEYLKRYPKGQYRVWINKLVQP